MGHQHLAYYKEPIGISEIPGTNARTILGTNGQTLKSDFEKTRIAQLSVKATIFSEILIQTIKFYFRITPIMF